MKEHVQKHDELYDCALLTVYNWSNELVASGASGLGVKRSMGTIRVVNAPLRNKHKHSYGNRQAVREKTSEYVVRQ